VRLHDAATTAVSTTMRRRPRLITLCLRNTVISRFL
jgi:hypothetical protein